MTDLICQHALLGSSMAARRDMPQPGISNFLVAKRVTVVRRVGSIEPKHAGKQSFPYRTLW